ncbi:hypothetical protein [Streptococcus sp. DD12]|uniref:hypothetical protein n=1 Tax=Streptococcus sp. DD12 TaxID=1777880 RepID=UPI0007982185|nr:hypothetical protein [Streptococcus sp. DD12]KXT76303.1 Cystathionine beta-lyase [Streptococcus sp. DD12]
MTDYLNLALTYGGFTQLDQAYLTGVLKGLSDKQKRLFITPPPSVINAFFAQYYQKESPRQACDYFFDLSQALELFQDQPSFQEAKPFIRLNLDGKAYGFAYQNKSEEALVFAEYPSPWTVDLALQVANLFPFYQVRIGEDYLHLKPLSRSLSQAQPLAIEDPLIEGWQWADGTICLRGYNQEDLLDLAHQYPGQKAFAFSDRQVNVYIEKE